MRAFLIVSPSAAEALATHKTLIIIIKCGGGVRGGWGGGGVIFLSISEIYLQRQFCKHNQLDNKTSEECYIENWAQSEKFGEKISAV